MLIGGSALEIHALLSGRFCGQGKKVGAGISPILEVASVRKCANVEPIILDIEGDGTAGSVMGAIKIDGCEFLVRFGVRGLRR